MRRQVSGPVSFSILNDLPGDNFLGGVDGDNPTPPKLTPNCKFLAKFIKNTVLDDNNHIKFQKEMSFEIL